ncbi:MAG: hypothetical protein JXA37_07740 [Chloroflexia bacterium]|nr:hypothetical protein [Chloroflexia bacterium]
MSQKALRRLRRLFNWRVGLVILGLLVLLLAGGQVLGLWDRLGLSLFGSAFGGGWQGEYWDNLDLSGSPQLQRPDSDIDFSWGTGAPAEGLPADNFSARWTRSLSFQEGRYRFYAQSDDGVRVWLDDSLLIDQWHASPGVVYMADADLAGGSHQLRVEYYEQGGWARLQFRWEPLSGQEFPDWQGAYYANAMLEGGPVLLRNDKVLDFNWGGSSPDAALLPADDFSVRWTRQAHFDAAAYRFHAVVDGGLFLWVGEQQVLDHWGNGSSRHVIGEISLARGEYPLKVEYFEGGGTAQAQIWWEKVQTQYYPDPSFADWKGSYWSNMEMRGSPTLVRNDGSIDFNWGTGAPAPGLPADQFSVRWDRELDFESGLYVFYAQGDNGLRVYLDGALLIDGWYSNGQEVLAADRVLRGKHQLTVEYYENGGPAQVRFYWQGSN